MKRTLLSVILLLLFLIPCLAQDNSQTSIPIQQARKFDEYLYISYEDHEAHVDRFAQELKKDPNSKAYVIAYDARVYYHGDSTAGGITSIADFALRMRVTNKISPERIVRIEGGLREKRMVELFIVPKGAIPPVPTPTFRADEAIHCPVINVSSPTFVWNTRLPLRFIASVKTDNSRIKPVYKWTVSSGEITNGQGTSIINVEQSVSNYQSITATVKVDGFSDECNTTFSNSSPQSLQEFPLKIDEFGLMHFGEATARMSAVASMLVSEPKLKAHIIVYAGKDNYFGVSNRYAERLRVYLITLGIDAKRVTAIDGGRQEALHTEIWLVPDEVKPPVPISIFDSKQIPENQVIKFDEYPFMLPNDEDRDMWDGKFESEFARLGRLAEVLKKRSDLRLYIIGRSQGVYVYKPIGRKLKDNRRKYIQVRSQKLSDPTGTDRKIANEEKRHLIKEYGIEASRITAIGNGYQKLRNSEPEILSSDDSQGLQYLGRTVELWLVPSNEPKTTLQKILKGSIE